MLRFVLSLSLFFGMHQLATAGIVRVADGDCVAFRNAFAQASAVPTTIMLARNGSYVGAFGACEAILQQGNLIIEGNGATITDSHIGGVGYMINVAAGASLTVRNLRIVDTTTTDHLASVNRFENLGALSFENVTINGNGWTPTFNSSPNSTATFRNTTWIKASLNGTFDAYNSTFVDSGLTLGPSGMSPTLQSHISLSNSLLSSSGQLCSQTNGGSLGSLGGNVLSDSSCGLFGVGDKVVSNLALQAAADHGGLVPTVQIDYASPAYRAGVAQYCEATDARGVARDAANCDAGAYEFGGGVGLVTANGMNGLYYVPGIANGHYVSVQRIHDNKDVMVFWNTFDRNGNQAWIFGVGTQTSARHVHALAYRNLGGVLQPGGPATGAKASQWGTVDIDLTSCAAAQFNYQSDLPEFGSGQFPLSRLAFESAIDCGD